MLMLFLLSEDLFRNFLMLVFISKCLLKSLWQRETQVSFFWKIIARTAKVLLTNLYMFLLFISIFQRNENRFISLVLKAKEQKAIQLPYISLKFYVINPPISFC